jgi:hypothetical protein
LCSCMFYCLCSCFCSCMFYCFCSSSSPCSMYFISCIFSKQVGL